MKQEKNMEQSKCYFGEEVQMLDHQNFEETDARYPGNDPKYKDLTKEELPKTENLVDTIKRVFGILEF